jgi:hypothetical protein
MTQLATILPPAGPAPETFSTPSPDAKPNGKGVGTTAPANDQVVDGMKRLQQIGALAGQIEAKKQEISAQETVKAEAESDLKTEREKLNKLEREKGELQEELDTLALGRHSERLPFTEKSNGKPAKGADVPADLQAAFNAATLADLGITGAMAEKLDADGIRCGAELQKWFAEVPPRKIPGIGESARDKINEKMADFFESRKQLAAAPERTVAAAAEKPQGPRDAGGKAKRFSGNKKLSRAKSRK